MSERLIPGERPTYGNWRLPSRPGIGALGAAGSAILLGGLVVTLVIALISWAAALALLLGGCALAPRMKTPVVPAGDAYKELVPWTQAQPADRLRPLAAHAAKSAITVSPPIIV